MTERKTLLRERKKALNRLDAAVAQVPTPCVSVNCDGEKHATKFIYVGNVCYGICEDCYKLFGKINQLTCDKIS